MLLDHLTDPAASTHDNMAYNFAASAPAMVLPPQAFSHFFTYTHDTSTTGDPSTNGHSTASTPPNESMVPTPGSLAGLKRSRGGDHSPDEDDLLEDGSLRPTAEPRGEPVHGPGMTLVYPDDPGYALVSGSQSGTWVEERAETEQSQLGNSIKRPSISARKSQRVDASATTDGDYLAQLVLPPHMREATAEPLIDEATRALGISWTRMDSTEVLRISQAAYSKWIQNHYPCLTKVSLWFENSAIPGYLAVATNAYTLQQEYYIFSHDLTEARLVTSDPTALVARLQMLPALHLAAPGGAIRAETDPISAAQNEVSAVQADAATSAIHDSPLQPESICTAHSMELD